MMHVLAQTRLLARTVVVAAVWALCADVMGQATQPRDNAAFLAVQEQSLRQSTNLPDDFWTWLQSHPEIRTGLLIAADRPVAEHARNLAALRALLGPARSDRYAHVLLAVSLRPTLSLSTDAPATKPPTDPAVEKLIAHLRATNTPLADVMCGAPQSLTELGITAPRGGFNNAFWDQVAQQLKIYPPRKSQTVDQSLGLLIDRYETKLPAFKDGPQWPHFPIDKTPWPLLAPLVQTLPRNESDWLWDHFTGKTPYPDGKRVRYYGRYSWDYELGQVKYKASAFHPNSIPRIAEDGGVCGRLSTFGQFTSLTLGRPAVGMYQPGHRAFLQYDFDARKNVWRTRQEQSITSADQSTASWFLPDPKGFRAGRNPGIEWHYALTHSMNLGLEAYTDSRISLLQARAKGKDNFALLRQAIDRNPFNLEAWHDLAQTQRHQPAEILALCREVDQRMGVDQAPAAATQTTLATTTDFNTLKPQDAGTLAKDALLVATLLNESMLRLAFEPLLKQPRERHAATQLLTTEVERRGALKKPYNKQFLQLLTPPSTQPL